MEIKLAIHEGQQLSQEILDLIARVDEAYKVISDSMMDTLSCIEPFIQGIEQEDQRRLLIYAVSTLKDYIETPIVVNWSHV